MAGYMFRKGNNSTFKVENMTLALHLSVALFVVIALVFLCFLMPDAIELLRLCKDRLREPIPDASYSIETHSHSEESPAVIILSNTPEIDGLLDFPGAQDHIQTISGNEKRSRRKKRAFAWPPRSLFVTRFTLEVPLYSPDGIVIPFLLEIPYRFRLPNTTGSFRKRRNVQERFSLYRTIELLFSRLGYDGHCCLLRAVCERADSDVMTEGLLGEILNLLLAVTVSSENNSELLWEYQDAEEFGKAQGDCEEKYKGCHFSIFHLFFDY